jgi:hypothetical protein
MGLPKLISQVKACWTSGTSGQGRRILSQCGYPAFRPLKAGRAQNGATRGAGAVETHEVELYEQIGRLKMELEGPIKRRSRRTRLGLAE